MSSTVALLVDDIPGGADGCSAPNARCHHMQRYRESQVARQAAYFCAAHALSRSDAVPGHGPIALHWTVFLGRGKRRRDADNVIAALKPYCDGIFDALGRNDADVVEIRVKQQRSPDGRPRLSCQVISLPETTS